MADMPSAVHRRSQPQRRRDRFRGLVGHGQQLGRERIEVGLVAELGAERLDDLGRGVAAAVEAPVDGVLDAPPGRLE
jgi:hypothetical protein